jgi:transcriptional regulator GlxA family with amidase domain
LSAAPSLPKAADAGNNTRLSRAGVVLRSWPGVTPAGAIERLGLEAARRQLSETRLPVKRIAEHCGFGSEETMRRSFLRLIAITPQDYRARFSS